LSTLQQRHEADSQSLEEHVVLQTIAGHRIGEDVADLERWVRELEGCPPVTHTVHVHCSGSAHTDEEPATWFYVEAHSADGLVRRRCLSCGLVVSSLDSEQRWTHPHMWSCATCGQSITEIVIGLHATGDEATPGRVSWAAFGVRCVGCGGVGGVADLVVPNLPYDEAVAAL